LDKYRIFENDGFISDIRGDLGGRSGKIQKKNTEYVYPQLRIEPHFGLNIKKLRDRRPDTWRYRIGNYRMFYMIDEEEKTVIITAFHIRGKAYKK
jgi:mRNA interferase RelE/StbE